MVDFVLRSDLYIGGNKVNKLKKENSFEVGKVRENGKQTTCSWFILKLLKLTVDHMVQSPTIKIESDVDDLIQENDSFVASALKWSK